MSLPLGHAAAGLTVAAAFSSENELHQKKSAYFLWAIFLSWLPDIDFIVYFLIPHNENAYLYRHVMTHSILFHVVITLSLVWFMPWKPKWRSALITFSILLSHSIVDSFYKNTPVAFFWPFGQGFCLGILPDIRIHGNMSVLIQKETLFHLFLEGAVGLAILILVILIKKIAFRNSTRP